MFSGTNWGVKSVKVKSLGILEDSGFRGSGIRKFGMNGLGLEDQGLSDLDPYERRQRTKIKATTRLACCRSIGGG